MNKLNVNEMIFTWMLTSVPFFFFGTVLDWFVNLRPNNQLAANTNIVFFVFCSFLFLKLIDYFCVMQESKEGYRSVKIFKHLEAFPWGCVDFIFFFSLIIFSKFFLPLSYMLMLSGKFVYNSVVIGLINYFLSVLFVYGFFDLLRYYSSLVVVK